MRQECVVPESQCQIKRESKRAQKDKDKPNSTTRDAPNGNSNIGPMRTSNTVPIHSPYPTNIAGQPTTQLPSNGALMMNGHQAHATLPTPHQQSTSTPPATHHTQNHHSSSDGTLPSMHQTVPPQLVGHSPQAHVTGFPANNHYQVPATATAPSSSIVPPPSQSSYLHHHQNHQTHQLHSHQNHHLNGVSSASLTPVSVSGSSTTIADQVTAQTQLSIDSNFNPVQASHHQGLTPHTVQLANSHQIAASKQAPTHGSLNGQFTPTGLPHSSPPTHLPTSASGIPADTLLVPNNRLASLHQHTQPTSLSPLSGHNTPINDRLGYLNGNMLVNQDLTIEQTMRARANKILQERIDILNTLIQYQEEYESPKEEDLRKVAPYDDSQSDREFKHMTDMTILTVKLVVEFAKKAPYFDQLTREDQITLLKAGASEIMMLRSTRKYDIKTDSILFANNQPFTRENYKRAHIGDIADAMFNFCRSTVILRLDPAEYALITALIIFSERQNLREPEKVESIQEFYLELMQAYVESREHGEKCKFARLLALLPELRALNVVNSDVCFSLRVKNHHLPEFLAEIWDVNQERQENDDQR